MLYLFLSAVKFYEGVLHINETPLQIARQMNYPEIITLLELAAQV